jgi:predicted ATPase
MIESIAFLNFKVLRKTVLPLGRFTLLVGPNGSGKSTALQAFQVMRQTGSFDFRKLATAGLQATGDTNAVELALRWGKPFEGVTTSFRWPPRNQVGVLLRNAQGDITQAQVTPSLVAELNQIRVYSLNARTIPKPVQLQPNLELSPEGGNLAGVLDLLRDQDPERFEELNQELSRMLPEFDRILFETPSPGQRAFLLRTRHGRHAISATDLSQGVLLALSMLTLGYLPSPPPLVGLEEPDRGIHPRLLRHVRDALYRLSYPETYGEKREPVQVVATTHSPYFLDLFKDHPEEIVIAQKDGLEARFERLVDRPDIEEILADAPLGEVWHSGVLGGVPAKP